jgi:hypothetical protein
MFIAVCRLLGPHPFFEPPSSPGTFVAGFSPGPLLREPVPGKLRLMAITIKKRSSEIPDEVYQAVVELGDRPEFEGDWHVSVLPAPDNEDWLLSLESRWMHSPAIDLAPEHQSPAGVQRALHSMLESLEEES